MCFNIFEIMFALYVMILYAYHMQHLISESKGLLDKQRNKFKGRKPGAKTSHL